MEWIRGEYTITDDQSRIDVSAVCAMLNKTYWAQTRSREVIEQSIRASVCCGLFHHQTQIGFARAVTDGAVFAWIADVVVDEAYKGRGLGTWLVECLVTHPRIAECMQVLRTRDAHALYEKFGFVRDEVMVRKLPSDWTLRSSQAQQ